MGWPEVLSPTEARHCPPPFRLPRDAHRPAAARSPHTLGSRLPGPRILENHRMPLQEALDRQSEGAGPGHGIDALRRDDEAAARVPGVG